jgi:hypothetical protein
VLKEDVLCVHDIPSIEVANFPEAPAAIQRDAPVEYVTAKIALAPKEEAC